jgi:hypothetical protein
VVAEEEEAVEVAGDHFRVWRSRCVMRFPKGATHYSIFCGYTTAALQHLYNIGRFRRPFGALSFLPSPIKDMYAFSMMHLTCF